MGKPLQALAQGESLQKEKQKMTGSWVLQTTPSLCGPRGTSQVGLGGGSCTDLGAGRGQRKGGVLYPHEEPGPSWAHLARLPNAPTSEKGSENT